MTRKELIKTHGIDEVERVLADVVKYRGRYWHAWQDEDGRWRAPTPRIGGAYVGSLDYVCSGAAVSRATRWALVGELMRE